MYKGATYQDWFIKLLKERGEVGLNFGRYHYEIRVEVRKDVNADDVNMVVMYRGAIKRDGTVGAMHEVLSYPEFYDTMWAGIYD